MDQKGRTKMSKKGAVLLSANYSNRTGYAWRNIYRLFNVVARHFISLGYPVVVSFSEIEGIIDVFDEDLNILFIKHNPNDRFLLNSLKFARQVKKHNIKYVYFTDQRFTDYRYALIRLMGVKKIIVHNRISVADPHPGSYESGVKGVIKSIMSRWHLITANRVYAVSDFVGNRLIMKNRVPDYRVVKILNGIDIDSFTPNSNSKSLGEPLKIFCGGRASVHKGIDVLIEATALLRSRKKYDFEVRYAGDGPDLKNFLASAEKHKLGECFQFLGELNSTRDEVVNADIIVVPSIWGDACPSSVSEALASGKPLIR